MESGEIARRFLAYFKQQGHTIVPSASLVADDPTVLFVIAVCSRSSRTCSASRRRRTGGWRTCRSASAPWTSKRSARPPGTLLSSRCSATGRSATTSRKARSGTPGSCRPGPRPTAASASQRTSCGPRSCTATTRRRPSGGTRSAWGSPDPGPAAWPTTTGAWACPAPAARARRSTTTAGLNTAATAARRPTRTASWRSGTWSSCRTASASSGPRTTSTSRARCRPRTSTPGWAWSGWRPSCRAWTTCTRSTPRGRSWTGPRSSPSRATAVTTGADVALRVIADRVRSAVMLVDDGVLPSNEGRGYVLRRIMRRSIRNLRLLAGAAARRWRKPAKWRALHARAHRGRDRGHGAPLPRVAAGRAEYPHGHRRRGSGLRQHAAHRYGDLRGGSRGSKRKSRNTISGAQAFQLHDTYSFPIDLTLEMASEQGLSVDEDGFRGLMAEQKERAKKDAAEKKTGNVDISVFADIARAVRLGHVHRLQPGLRRGRAAWPETWS